MVYIKKSKYILACLVLASILAGRAAAVVRVPMYTQGMFSHDKKAPTLTSNPKLMTTLPKHVTSDPKPKLSDNKPLYYKVLDIYIHLGIGTPPQMLNIAIDTGEPTSDLWVPAIECNSVFCNNSESRYNHKLSSTYVEVGTHFDVEIEASNCSGYQSQDVVTLGDVQIPSQVFGEAVSVWAFDMIFYNGILSLGSRRASSTSPVPLFYNMLKENLIEKQVFGMYFDLSKTNYTSRGELILGGGDPTRYEGELTYTKLTSDKQWQFDLELISVAKGANDTVDFCHGGCNAVMDTATTDIVGPYDTVYQLHSEMGAILFDMDNFYGYCFFRDCTKQPPPPLIFHMEGKEFELTWEKYTYTVTEGLCCTQISGVDIDYWAMGGIFLRSIYTEFDVQNSRLGFAKLA